MRKSPSIKGVLLCPFEAGIDKHARTVAMYPPHLSGPHHCIGTARAIVDLVFQQLSDMCSSNDECLTRGDLKTLHAALVESLAAARLPWMQDVFKRCMDARMQARVTLERETIVAALLGLWLEDTIGDIFAKQVARGGAAWPPVFLDAVGRCIVRYITPQIGARLFAAYARLASRYGADLSVSDLKRDPELSLLVTEMLLFLTSHDAMCDAIMLAQAVNDAMQDRFAAERVPDVVVDAEAMAGFLARTRHVIGLPPKPPAAL
jgi:hypothetical protein